MKRIVERGTVEEIFNNPKHKHIQNLIRSAPNIARRDGSPLDVPIQTNEARVSTSKSRNGGHGIVGLKSGERKEPMSHASTRNRAPNF
jgi:ABC-type dipeptide/oligopeptide/nickel transport system ATPase component